MEMTTEGAWLLKTFEAAKLMIFPSGADTPEFEVTFGHRPILDVLRNFATVEAVSIDN